MMDSPDNWKIDLELIKYLATQLNKGRLCVVLGAGISSSFGLPDWEKLIKNLYHDDKEIDLSKKKLTEIAEEYESSHKATYIADVQKALYKDAKIDFKQLTAYSTLTAIGALVMASRRSNTSKVITFNFDDILELYLNYFGFISCSRYEQKHWATNADVEIYHPHGFLSHDGKIMSDNIIFSTSSYSQIVGDRTNPWNIHLNSIMMTHTCLFIGLSGDDQNLDSIIHAVINGHVGLKKGYPYWGVSFINHDNDAKWKSRKIFPFKVLSDFSNLPDFLFSIAQQAARQRMKE